MITEAAQKTESKFASQAIPLVAFEDVWCRISDRYDGDGIGEIVAWVAGDIDERKIRTALDMLQMRHPKLRARVATKEKNSLVFEFPDPPPQIPLEIRDVESSATWLDDAYEAFFQKLALATGPMCRVLVMRDRAKKSCCIVFIAHHSIIDASCLLAIVDDLLGYYRQIEECGPSVPSVVSRSFVSFERAPERTSFLRTIGLILIAIKAFFIRSQCLWVTLPAARRDPPRPWIWRHEFSPDETSKILRRCREERTSFTSVLQTASAKALAGVLNEERIRIEYSIYFDIRHLLESPDGSVTKQDLGCFVSSFGNNCRIERSTPFWDAARAVWEKMQDFVLNQGPETYFNAVRFAKGRSPKIPLKRDTMTINYFGVQKLNGDYGSLQLEGYLTMAKGAIFGASINVWAVVYRGKLSIWIVLNDLPEEFSKKYWRSVLQQFRTIID